MQGLIYSLTKTYIMQTKTSRILGGLVVAGCLFFMASCKPSDTQITQAASTVASTVAPGVTVSVKNGAVTLDGTVSDAATKEALDSAIKTVKGVVTVVDNTTPPPPAAAPVVINPDDLVRNTIDSLLATKNISGVKVSVSNGEVTLSGNAKRKDLKTIMQIASESHPQKVVNQLTIQ